MGGLREAVRPRGGPAIESEGEVGGERREEEGLRSALRCSSWCRSSSVRLSLSVRASEHTGAPPPRVCVNVCVNPALSLCTTGGDDMTAIERKKAKDL